MVCILAKSKLLVMFTYFGIFLRSVRKENCIPLFLEICGNIKYNYTNELIVWGGVRYDCITGDFQQSRDCYWYMGNYCTSGSADKQIFAPAVATVPENSNTYSVLQKVCCFLLCVHCLLFICRGHSEMGCFLG